MSPIHPCRLLALAVVFALVLPPAAGADAKIRSKKAEGVDFRSLRTWSWHPKGEGDVKMAVSADDNPDALRARWNPVIKDAVEKGFAERNLTTDSASPQLHVTYYLLINTNMSAQTLGQFAPAVPEWGLPPFTGATQSLRVFEQGSLVLDVSSTASGELIWRGIVQAEVNRDRTQEEREVRVRAAIADLLKKFPNK
jgi:hypothetical protein